MNGGILAERYERTMSRLEQITRAGYLVKVQWEYQFDDACIVKQKTELLAHSLVLQRPLRARDAMYGERTETMHLHYKSREKETIKYVDDMRCYPYIYKYFNLPVSHPIIHVGDECKNINKCLGMDGPINSSIVPPEKLYHPVLPFRCNKKLMICLCRTFVHTSSIEGMRAYPR